MKKGIVASVVLLITTICLVIAYFVLVSKVQVFTYNGFAFSFDSHTWLIKCDPTNDPHVRLSLKEKNGSQLNVNFSGVKDIAFPPIYLPIEEVSRAIPVTDTLVLYCGEDSCISYDKTTDFEGGYLLWYGEIMGSKDATITVSDFEVNGGDGNLTSDEISTAIDLIKVILSARKDTEK